MWQALCVYKFVLGRTSAICTCTCKWKINLIRHSCCFCFGGSWWGAVSFSQSDLIFSLLLTYTVHVSKHHLKLAVTQLQWRWNEKQSKQIEEFSIAVWFLLTMFWPVILILSSVIFFCFAVVSGESQGGITKGQEKESKEKANREIWGERETGTKCAAIFKGWSECKVKTRRFSFGLGRAIAHQNWLMILLNSDWKIH